MRAWVAEEPRNETLGPGNDFSLSKLFGMLFIVSVYFLFFITFGDSLLQYVIRNISALHIQ